MARISLRVSEELKAACDAAGAGEVRRVLEEAFGRPGSGGLAVGLSAVSPAAAVAASEDAASIPDAAPSAQGDDGVDVVVGGNVNETGSEPVWKKKLDEDLSRLQALRQAKLRAERERLVWDGGITDGNREP